MTVLDTKFRNLSSKLIKKFGKSVDFKVLVKGVVQSTTTIKGFLTQFKNSEIDGTMVKRSDLLLLIPTLDLDNAGIVLDTTDKVFLENYNYNIVDIFPVYSGEQVALTKAQLRK